MRAVFKIYADNSPSMGRLFKGVIGNTTEINALRQELVQGRLAYWMRKAEGYGQVYGKAKVELSELIFRIRQAPGSFTGRDLGVGAVCAVHIYGCFIIGEMLGRGSVAGYKQGRLAPHEGI
jgi:hypothetical protein